MRIEKKTCREYFQQILEGNKTSEVRLADWECNPGDILILREWDNGSYTGRVLEKRVSYVLKSKDLKFFSKKDIEKHGFQVICWK